MIIILLFLAITQPVEEGWASQYSPGVMEATVDARQDGCCTYNLPRGLPLVDGYVATQNCSDIGKIILLRPQGNDKWEKFLIADCAGPGAYSWMTHNNILVEVDYKTAIRWDTIGKGIRIEMKYPHYSSKYKKRQYL